MDNCLYSISNPLFKLFITEGLSRLETQQKPSGDWVECGGGCECSDRQKLAPAKVK